MARPRCDGGLPVRRASAKASVQGKVNLQALPDVLKRARTPPQVSGVVCVDWQGVETLSPGLPSPLTSPSPPRSPSPLGGGGGGGLARGETPQGSALGDDCLDLMDFGYRLPARPEGIVELRRELAEERHGCQAFTERSYSPLASPTRLASPIQRAASPAVLSHRASPTPSGRTLAQSDYGRPSPPTSEQGRRRPASARSVAARLSKLSQPKMGRQRHNDRPMQHVALRAPQVQRSLATDKGFGSLFVSLGGPATAR